MTYPKEDLAYIGKRIPIRDAYDKVIGKPTYVGDMRLPGMLYAKMLFSSIPHGYIKKIDMSEAEAVPGVKFIATCFNTPHNIYNSAKRFKGHNMKPDEEIFPKKVRYIGDRVAAVVAESEQIAQQALKLIKVEYEELHGVYDPEKALVNDTEIHDGGNLLGTLDISAGDTEAALKNADYVFEGRYTTPIIHHYAMEPHTALADWDGKRLTVWTSAQNIFAYRILLSEILSLPVNRVRVIKPTVGGGFGGKFEMVLEPVVAYLAMRTGKPVLLELSRKDSMISTRTRHAAITYLKTGVQKDGTITGVDYKVIVNAGAYAGSTMNVIGGMSAKAMMLYRVPNMHFSAQGVYTNSPVGGAMRGYGSPQIITPLEMHLDKVAKKLDIDPLELRIKNLVIPGDVNPANQASLGNCQIVECARRGAELIGWDKKEKSISEGKIKKGIGMACGVHGNGVFPKMIDTTTITLKVAEDGSIILFTGNQDLGQGIVTAQTQIVGEVLNIDPDLIEVVESDTTTTNFDMGTFSSRGIWVSGKATKLAAEELLENLIEEASLILKVAKEDILLTAGWFKNKFNPEEKVSLEEVALHAQQETKKGEFIVNKTYYSIANPGTYAAHFAEVEVDTETGKVKVQNFVAVHDIGKAINPFLVEGQIEGGIQMGLGYALTEELIIDPNKGNVINAHTKKYPLFKAKDMPEIQISLVEEGEDLGPFGAKSIGEIATVPVAGAIINAINAALGTNIGDLPAKPERILEALSKVN